MTCCNDEYVTFVRYSAVTIYIAEKVLMVLLKPTYLTLSHTCVFCTDLPTLLTLDDGCLIAVYFLLRIVWDISYY